MKIRMTFKDPDVVGDAFSDAEECMTEFLMKELGISKEAAEVETAFRLKKLKAIAARVFDYGEYVTIELDPDTETARVVMDEE